MPDLTQDQWQAAVEALGPDAANEWLANNGMTVGGRDPVADEIATLTPPTLSAPQAPLGGAPKAPGYRNQLQALYGDLFTSQERGEKLRQQMMEEATEALKARRFGPSLSERLFALSAAFAQPTRQRGFSGVMGNVMPVLAKTQEAMRTGEQAKADALLALRQKYLLGNAEGEQQGIRNRIELAKAMKSGNDMGTWSEALGRFVPKTHPVVIQSGILNGQRTEKLSDGNIRVYASDGSYALYDAGGTPVSEVNDAAEY